MSVLKVLEWPHPILETKAEPVKVFDAQVQLLVKDMHDTMKASNGIGLAANQIGSLQRIVTMEIPFSESRYSEQETTKEWWHNKKFTFINPEIIKKQGKISYQEGCLSFPDIYDFVDRAAEVWVKAVDENNKAFEVHATGLFAVCIQHEIDHIDGIVFINRMSRLKSGLIRKKILRRATVEMEKV